VREIWEQTVPLNSYDAIAAALQRAGVSIESSMMDFAVALLLRDFEEGETFPVLRLEGSAADSAQFTPADGVGQMAADYVEIEARDPITIAFSGDLDPLLVGLADGTASIYQAGNKSFSVDAARFDHLYLVPVNTAQASSEYNCTMTDYSFTVSRGNTHQAPDAVLPAPNFSPPAEEELMDPDEIWGEGWEEEYPGYSYPPADAPPELIPAYLPAGYELYEAYTMQAEDFGEDALWFAPGGGELIVVDFYGPGEDDYLSVSSALNPYDSYEEFFDAAEWEPYDEEWYRLGGRDVVIEDYSDEIGPYAFATILLGDQFIVVEGNLSTGEMARVVESLLD